MTNPAPNQELADRVMSILNTDAIQQIGFEIENTKCLVTGARYRVLADKIRSGNITCVVGVPQDPNLGPMTSVAATYVPTSGSQGDLPPNQFHFKYAHYGEYSDEEKVTIVHEATHAIFDVFNVGNILAIDDESAAWLASALYSRIAQRSMGGAIMDGSPTDESLKLADRIIATRTRRTYIVRPAEISALRLAVAEAYNLVGGRATIIDQYDGV